MKYLPLIILCVIAFFYLKKRFFDNTDYKSMLANGGVIIDVRSSGEFFGGHIDNSLNIPLGDLPDKLDYLKDKNQPIITCCASGMRSAEAAKLLSAKGYTNVVNGGGWSSLENKLK
ncbi:MAG: rhodanese-like domain-containing protein [Flavobacteriales bacterium]|jgi:phage shock protein E|nr:rhodanese-like domain-containing protein [Flavobacteriales bacterium]MBT5750034.1 rhodanese-like domain-containing protein [Flavobacteriales bacterium]